jgi:ADP-ribose pyrophosphatase
LVESRLVYDNGWIRVDEDQVIRPSGEKGLFGIITMKEGSTVLPVCENDDIYLVREYKYGIASMSIEAMSGGLDPGEDPLVGAKRELAEELGLKAQKWTYLGYVDPFTTLVRSRNHMYLAEGLESGRALDDPDEVVEGLRMPLAQAVEMAMTGEITHSASCVLLLKADRLLRARLTQHM